MQRANTPCAARHPQPLSGGRTRPTAGVKPYLNDYNIEGFSAKSDAYYQLAKQLKADRVPIHGMGVQGHLGVQFGFWAAGSVADNLHRYEELGLETSITEADVRMLMPPDNAKLQAQANGLQHAAAGVPARQPLHLVRGVGLHRQVLLRRWRRTGHQAGPGSRARVGA